MTNPQTRPDPNRRARRATLAFALALVVVTATACANNGSTTASTVNAGSPQAPAAVAGYGSCTDPSCADVARACDDLIRSGCAGPFGDAKASGTPLPGTSAFQQLLDNCTLVSFQELYEDQESVGPGGPGQGEDGGATEAGVDQADRTAAMQALEEARCTRRATTCDQRLDCLRGQTIAPRVPGYDASVPVDAGADAPVAPQPSWKTPWRPTATPDPLWGGPPWADAGKNPNVFLVPGVDSPSCARCAIERCPTFAYQCFSAENDPQDCPNADCCESLRKCVWHRGGYAPGARAVDFYYDVAQCEVGRPHAAQGLANLQHCAQVACTGCKAFDKSVTIVGSSAGGWTRVDGGP